MSTKKYISLDLVIKTLDTVKDLHISVEPPAKCQSCDKKDTCDKYIKYEAIHEVTDSAIQNSLEGIVSAFRKIPTEYLRVVGTGQWAKLDDHTLKCLCCGEETLYDGQRLPPICQWCGVDMK